MCLCSIWPPTILQALYFILQKYETNLMPKLRVHGLFHSLGLYPLMRRNRNNLAIVFVATAIVITTIILRFVIFRNYLLTNQLWRVPINQYDSKSCRLPAWGNTPKSTQWKVCIKAGKSGRVTPTWHKTSWMLTWKIWLLFHQFRL